MHFSNFDKKLAIQAKELESIKRSMCALTKRRAVAS